MKQTNQTKSTQQPAMPQELAGAMNLMAHPMAGMAAMSAIGFGLASHAMGLWLGSVAGFAETARRIAEDAARSERTRPTEPSRKLRLVASSDIPDRSGAAVRTMIADAEIAVRETTAVMARVTGDIVDEAVSAKPAQKKPRAARKAAAAVVSTGKASAVRPAAVEKPARPDDLKAISGVGPKLEKVLNGLGIWSYAQIASLSDAEIAWLDDQLGFSGRIDRDGWIGQAKALAGSQDGEGA